MEKNPSWNRFKMSKIEEITKEEYENTIKLSFDDVASDMGKYSEDYDKYLIVYNYLLDLENQHNKDKEKYILKYVKEGDQIWYKKLNQQH